MSKTIAIEDIPIIVDSLYEKIILDGFLPDAVICIERAGKIIGEPLAKLMNVKTADIKAERPGGIFKKKLSKIFYFVPYRIIQKIKYLELKCNINRINRNRSIVLKENIDMYKNLLVVDDAIDSGETVKQVVDFIRNSNRKTNIKVAAITTTNKVPLVTPDYFLYKNTVCNFPWSIDSQSYTKFISLYGGYYK